MMKPLFLVSLPRSGSTMVQAVLSNHLRIATCPEPWIQLVRSAFSRRNLVSSRFGWRWTLDALAACRPEASLLQEIEKQIAGCADQLYCGFSTDDTAYFLDKTPRYYLILEELFERYPDARFIVLRRDLISVLASIKNTWLSDQPVTALDAYGYDLIDGPRLLDQFVENRKDSARVKVVTYEEIVKAPLEGFAALFEWLELDFNEEVLDYGENKSFRGRLGDPNCPTMSGVRQQMSTERKGVDELFLEREWRRFAKGYIKEVGKWDLDPEWRALWGRGKFSIGFEAFLARHFWRKHETPPTVRQGAFMLLDALCRLREPRR